MFQREENYSGNSYGYLLIFIFIILIYLVTIPFYIRFNNTVLPSGDPYTYTRGWFTRLDIINDDWTAGLKSCFMSNWYWMMNLMIFIFSPILVKEPFSISLVNFVMWGIATAAVYRLVRQLRFSEGFAFITAWLIWLQPVNYGFMTYESVPVLALDSMFLATLILFTANLFYFACEPEKIKAAVIAGVSACLAISARGFSIAVIAMISLCPLLFLAYRVVKEKNYRIALNILAFIVVIASAIAFLLSIQGATLKEYYGHYPDFVGRFKLDWLGVKYWLKNIPGFHFWRELDSSTTISIGIICHLLVLVSVYIAVWRIKNLPAEYRLPLRLIALTSAFIYWTTYIVNILLWHYPYFTVYNCILQYSPMRIADTFCIFTIAAYLVLTQKINVGRWTMFPMLAFAVLYGGIMTMVQTPKPIPGMPSPDKVEQLAKDFDRLTKGGSVSIIWPYHYNASLLNYYRVKNNIPPLKLFSATPHYNRFWYSDPMGNDRLGIREELIHHFEEASIIIIGEYLDYYHNDDDSHYVISYFSEEIAKYLNSPNSAHFVVRMILSDYNDQQVLVLQREKDANGQGEPLKLPYGYKKDRLHSAYGDRVEKFENHGYGQCTNGVFDNSDFFEKVGLYPHAVFRNCNIPIVVKSYSVGAGPKSHAAHMRMPTAWSFQGSNDKLHWIDLDAQEEQVDWVDDEVRVFDIDKTGSYQFYRLLATEGIDPSIIRLYAFDLNPKIKSVKRPGKLKGGIVTASMPNAEKLIDGIIQPTSMWSAGSAGWWKYAVKNGLAKSLSQYVLYGWDSSNNGPTAWTFEGSNDDVNWIVLDTQKEVLWKDGEIKVFPISNPVAYKYFKLNITSPGKGGLARLMEVKMIEFIDTES